MTGFSELVGVLLSLGSIAAQAAPSATHAVVVATPTFGVDGSATGGKSTFPLTIGRPQVIYASAGRSLCESGSPTSGADDDAGYGWRVEATARELKADGVLVLDLVWQRRWQDGRARDGDVSRSQVRLAEGSRILLDYLSGLPAAPCPALGMALEIGRPARPAVGLFEAEAWLVPAVNGEPVQRQMVRIREGDKGKFYFDDMGGADGRGRAQIEAALTLETHASGRFESLLTIARHDTVPGAGGPSGGSSGFPLKAAFGETVEFRVPMGGFSLRVRVRQLR
jgi:hypothetical protein